jgi:hypothetical protein
VKNQPVPRMDSHERGMTYSVFYRRSSAFTRVTHWIRICYGRPKWRMGPTPKSGVWCRLCFHTLFSCSCFQKGPWVDVKANSRRSADWSATSTT